MLEPQLDIMIRDLFAEILVMHPKDGLSSPRDIELAKEINKQTAILDHLQDAMRVMNPLYEIRDQVDHNTYAQK